MVWHTDSVLNVLHLMAAMAYRVMRYARLSFEARLIEYDFVKLSIPDSKGLKQKILDIGSGGSSLPGDLAKIGKETYSIDFRPPPRKCSFTFVQGDVRQMPFLDDFFDIVTIVSTIEHVGLGRYGDPIDTDGDKKAIEEIRRIVKPGGMLIMTIPCGYDTICYSKDRVPLGKVYSSQSLLRLLLAFQIMEMSYISKRKRVWFDTSLHQAEKAVRQANPDKVGMTAIALIVVHKPKDNLNE